MPDELTEADRAHRANMRARLQRAAEHFSVNLIGEVVLSWRDRTIGSRVHTSGGQRWLRVSWSQARWVYGDWWTGNQDANALTGVPKPRVLDVHDWDETDERWGDCCNRAELMTLVTDTPCSTTQELRAELDVSESWWTSLRAALDTLAEQSTERGDLDRQQVTGRLMGYFGTQATATEVRWVTAHGDLNWTNLTQPNLVLLDWEHWGTNVFGFDPATMYVLSLLAPDTANKVHDTFSDILDSPAGIRAQLFAITRYLKRVETGDFVDYVDLLHGHARRLLDSLG